MSSISEFIAPGRRVHMVGIGGVSMCALAEVLAGMGMTITGSDRDRSAATDRLEAHGIKVFIGHDAKNIIGAEALIHTAAVHEDNPEMAAAKAAGIPIFARAAAWGSIMQAYKNAVCVSGTHGKTTTTSMITHILMHAQMDPTVMIGGYLPLLEAGHRVGKGDSIILESCEYCNSFLNFHPTVAVVLNIEADHLDFFKDLADVQESFYKFVSLLPEDGVIVANHDDDSTMKTVSRCPRRTITFGLGGGADVYAENVKDERYDEFDVMYRGEKYCRMALSVSGRHNAMNALAACAAACAMNIGGETCASALADFHGAGRRMELKGEYNGAKIYDDYAHHPGELHALLTAAKNLGYERVICVFQPHTYSRTIALFDDFVRELSLADAVLLAEIYSARETNTTGTSSALLAERIPGAVFCDSFEEIERRLREMARPGDLILTVGAGDVYKIGEALVRS